MLLTQKAVFLQLVLIQILCDYMISERSTKDHFRHSTFRIQTSQNGKNLSFLATVDR